MSREISRHAVGSSICPVIKSVDILCKEERADRSAGRLFMYRHFVVEISWCHLENVCINLYFFLQRTLLEFPHWPHSANRKLGFFRRNIKTKMLKVREMTYNTLVRPLEYAWAVWGPHTNVCVWGGGARAGGGISQIEQIQWTAARWRVSNFDDRWASVTGILHEFGWRTLEQWRADASLCLVYKVVHGFVAVLLTDHVQYNNRISRYCHSMTFRQVHTSRDYLL